MKKPFLETTWSKVKAGDTVLMAWKPLDSIVKVEIKQCVTEPGPDEKSLVIARFVALNGLYGRAFDADETAYVQSRL